MSSGIKKRLDYNLNWSEYFQLDTDSPSGLVRIKDRYGKPVEKYNVGTKMFYKTGEANSWQLNFKSKMYLVHRIIWVLTYGSIDLTLVIDHLDGDPLNNEISNLSLKTHKNNSRNQRQHSNNKTGVTGVSLMCNKNGNWYYTAKWNNHDGKLQSKYFSIAKLGEENAKNLAIIYREDQIRLLIAEGADYTERHGT